MDSYDLAIFLVGSPSFTFQSAASSVARVLESFDVGESVTFYSAFARREAERLSLFVKRLFDHELRLEPLPRDMGEALETFRRHLKRGGRALVVPTSGSLLGAVALTLAASRAGADVGHVLFPFGPWTGFHYPYVPRYLQPIRVLGSPPAPKRPSFDRDGAIRYLEEEAALPTRLFKRIAGICVDLNLSLPQAWVNDPSIPKLVLELGESVERGRLSKTLSLKTSAGSVRLCVLSTHPLRGEGPPLGREKSIGVHPPPSRELFGEFVAEALSLLAGGGESCRRAVQRGRAGEWMYRLVGFELINLSPDERYLIDTNLVYLGVHNAIRPAGPQICAPYCVHAEVLDKVAESKGPCERLLAEVLLMAYEVVEAGASKVPSTQHKCDIAIPAIDPELIKDTVLLTADKRAYELWKKLAVSRYTTVKLVDDSAFRPPSESESHFALLQLAAILCELAALHHRR